MLMFQTSWLAAKKTKHDLDGFPTFHSLVIRGEWSESSFRQDVFVSYVRLDANACASVLPARQPRKDTRFG